MKKLPLAIAMLSLFTVSNSFSEEYRQSFEVSLNIPSSIDVEAFQRQMVNLSMDDLSNAMNNEGVMIGSMNINTTAKHCLAFITTDNHFNLQGESGALPYTIDYIAKNETGSAITTNFSTNDSYDYLEKSVGCNTGDLKLRLSRTENSISGIYGTYNDVIHVIVRAES